MIDGGWTIRRSMNPQQEVFDRSTCTNSRRVDRGKNTGPALIVVTSVDRE